MIPKIIHYCWFGRGEKPKLAERCIASWRKFHPEYEIIEWNEDNFNIDYSPYTRWCYDNKKYAFLSDFVRLWAVNEHGGLYFDTDVEVVRSFDTLMGSAAFFGWENNSNVASGLGFGAEAYDTLYAYVLSRIQYWSEQAEHSEEKLLQRLLNAGDKERTATQKKQTVELTKAEKRKAEIDRLFMKMYEDWSSGKITEYNFNMLSQKYQEEQTELECRITQLKENFSQVRQNTSDAEKWIALIRKYAYPTELTAELLNTLIEKIVIYEPENNDGEKTQKIEIYYRFVGKID